MGNLSVPTNRRIVLNTRPKGEPDDSTMRLEQVATTPPQDGQMLVRNHYLSLDPYMRGMMSDRDSYAEPIPLGGVMVGATISDGAMTFKLDPDMPHKSLALGILGVSGLTAWAGLREKCDIAVGKLGFDACIDHRAPDFEAQLKAAVPDGIDIYFENVGGRVLCAVVPLLNQRARIPLCGNIVTYNNPDQPTEGLADRLDIAMARFQQYRILIQGFLVTDYLHLWSDFHAEVMPWIEAGEIAYVEDVSKGLKAAPQGLRDVLSGRNMGKKVIDLAA